MTQRSIRVRAMAMALVISLGHLACAGQVNLNDDYNGGAPFVSDNYMWIDVTETNGAPAEPAIHFYQDPLTIGDTLIVNPTGFRAEVNPGPGVFQVDSQLEMVIMGDGGLAIPEIAVYETGDYNVLGTGDGTISSTHVSAELDYFWQVLEGASAGVTGSDVVRFEAFPDSSGKWNLDFSAALPAGATKVRFEFDNRVTARAIDNNSLAFIAKKQIEIKIVPEPASWSLLGLALLAVMARRLG